MRFSATGMLLNWAILLLTLIPAVVNGLIPAAAGKEASSVVIGLLGTYSAQGFEDMSQLKLDPYMTPGWQIYDDIIIEQAVQMINANASILPNTTLKLRRFTINDPTEKNGATGSLGFASMVALNISQSKENQDVIAVIGDWKVQQLFIGAQIYSYYNIPMCGIICNTERVDSKTNFKSFFRTRSSGRGYGKHILKFLMARKVSRIGIISDASSRGREESDDTVRELTSNDIEVVVLSYSTDAAYNVGLLQKYDARYILVTTTNRAFLGELYFTGLKSGLVSRRHVWISGNTPYYSSALDYLKLPQSPYNEVAGFVWLYGAPLLNWNGSDYPPTYHHLAKSMRANWPVVKQMSVANLNLDIMTDFLAYHPPKAYMEGAFDCIMTLASGFDKLLRENSSLTPEMLSSRKLQQKLNIPLWQRSGYQGIGNMPLIINDVGSSEIAYYWISVKRLDVNGDPVGNIFLTTGQDGSSTYYENSTTLYGNATAWPVDGSRTWNDVVLIPQLEKRGILLTFFSCVGLALCLTCFLFNYWFRKRTIIKKSNVYLNFLATSGSCFLYASMFCYLNTPTRFSCIAKVVLPVLGLGLMFGSFIAKTAITYLRSYVNVPAVVRNWVLFLIMGVIIFIEIAQVVYWDVQSRSSPTLIILNESERAIACVSGRRKLKLTAIATILVVNVLLSIVLLALAFFTRRVRVDYNESAVFTMLATSYITIFGLFYAADLSDSVSSTHEMREAMLIWALATITLLTYFGSKAWSLWIERKSARKFLVALRRTTRQVSQAFKTVVTTDIKKSPSDLAIYKAPTLRAVGSVRKVNSVKAKKKTNRVVHLTFPSEMPYQRYSGLKWTTWELAKITICAVTDNQAWILFESKHGVYSIPFEELTQAKITSNLLTHHVTISNGKSNFLVDPNGEDEFSISLCPVKLMCESREEANAFAGILKELQGAANGDTTIHRMLQSPRFQQTKG